MSTQRIVAAAQIVVRRGDVEWNVRRHVRLARAAADEGAQIVLFPEMSLTGYELDRARDLAFTGQDERLGPLAEAAAAGALTLVVGAPVRAGSRLHIGAFIVSPDGGIALYTKRRLGAFGPSAAVDGVVPPAEATVFQPGDHDPLVRLGARTAAVAICADIGAPEHPRQAAQRGATTYLASMFVIPSEFDAEAAALSRYAAEHAMAVVMANHGGPTGGLASAGRSSLWSERGDLVARLEDRGDGVALGFESDQGWRGRAIRVDGA